MSDADPRILRYGWEALRGDYWRAAAGLALTGLPLGVVEAGSVGMWVFAVAAAMFVLLALRTVVRQRTAFVLSDTDLQRRGPFGERVLSWQMLRRLKLRFFSTRRDRSVGWMQLRLSDDAGSVVVDSTLQDFDDVARRASRAAVDNDVTLSPATLANLAALGVIVETEDAQVTKR